jgi:ribonuclease P protein component
MPRFTKNEKVLKTSDFKNLYKSGKKVFSKNFFVVWKNGAARKVGLTVSSRVGNSVVRNRIKRVVREFFRSNKEKFPLGQCIVTAKDGAGLLTNEEIKKEMEFLLKKI